MKVLKLNGGPRQMGQVHGESFKKEIHELAQIRKELITRYLTKTSPQQLIELARAQIHALKKYPAFSEEFNGISEASGVSVEDLMILNNYTDMRDFDYLRGSQDPGGCSSLFVKTQKGYFCGQTWDMHASATPYVIQLEIEAKKTKVLTLTGCLGLAGVNEDSVVVMINNMHCQETSTSLMWPALVRGMLQQSTAGAAAQYLKENIPCSGHNYLICDPTSVFNIETTGKRWETTFEKKDLQKDSSSSVYFHTNHYVGNLKSEEIIGRQSKSTFQRYEGLAAYFKKELLSGISYKQIAQDIFSGEKVPAVCIAKPLQDPHAPMTCGGLIFDMNKKSGEAFQGIYSELNRTEI